MIFSIFFSFNSIKMPFLLGKIFSNLLPNHALRPILRRTKCDAASGKNRKLKKLKEKYQVEDSLPVFLKGGALDRTIYLTTIGLSISGTALVVYRSYLMAVSSSN